MFIIIIGTWSQCRKHSSKTVRGRDKLNAVDMQMIRVTGNLEPIPGGIGHKAGYTMDRVPVHRRAQSHTLPFIHYGQFRHANQPTMHVFGLG
ncbi:hypothetical protein AMELA_G00216220, partial [Ameiurus melas]